MSAPDLGSAGKALAERTRRAQGLAPTIDDPGVLHRVAQLVASVHPDSSKPAATRDGGLANDLTRKLSNPDATKGGGAL